MHYKGSSRAGVSIVLACGLEVSEFDLQSHHYFHFRINTLRKGTNPLFSNGLDCDFFYKDVFGIK